MVERDLEELAALVQRASHAVVFTGAGISTECGIPDFRSPGGFWTRHKPIEFAEFMGSEKIRREAWRRFFVIRDRFGGAVPGKGHAAVAELVRRGHASCVITQNIDGLHESSGVPAKRIIEIHGNGTYARCLTCERHYELDWARAAIAATDAAPLCETCGGIVKPATISFGQPMPEQAMADARAATIDADLFLAIGSSLRVFPAAGLPVMAAHNGTPLVIVNREPTGLDELAALTINGEIGEVLGAVMELARDNRISGARNAQTAGRRPA